MVWGARFLFVLFRGPVFGAALRASNGPGRFGGSASQGSFLTCFEVPSFTRARYTLTQHSACGVLAGHKELQRSSEASVTCGWHTNCCACHEICTSRFIKCCACHEICTSRFVPATKSALRDSQCAVPATNLHFDVGTQLLENTSLKNILGTGACV